MHAQYKALYKEIDPQILVNKQLKIEEQMVKIQQQSIEIENLKQRMSQQQQQFKNKYLSEVEDLKMQINKRNQIQASQKQQQSEQKCQEMQNIDQEITKLHVENNKLIIQNQDLTSTIKQLQIKQQFEENNNKQSIIQIQEKYESAIRKAKKRYDDVACQNQLHQQEIQQLNVNNQKLQIQVSIIQQLIKDRDIEVQKLSLQNQEQANKIKLDSQELLFLKQQIQLQQKQIETNQLQASQFQQLVIQKQQLSKELKSQEFKIISLNDTIVQQHQDLSKLENIIESKQQMITQLQSIDSQKQSETSQQIEKFVTQQQLQIQLEMLQTKTQQLFNQQQIKTEQVMQSSQILQPVQVEVQQPRIQADLLQIVANEELALQTSQSVLRIAPINDETIKDLQQNITNQIECEQGHQNAEINTQDNDKLNITDLTTTTQSESEPKHLDDRSSIVHINKPVSVVQGVVQQLQNTSDLKCNLTEKSGVLSIKSFQHEAIEQTNTQLEKQNESSQQIEIQQVQLENPFNNQKQNDEQPRRSLEQNIFIDKDENINNTSSNQDFDDDQQIQPSRRPQIKKKLSKMK
ncbi:Hypothetical_protein [Hexamita inflata]|uniref:Hypothetical_protein n=1 Tax=Hexamita inflata TaxID=28002 RepID=A0AA86RB70_9EUKA|nr:Hypothetical protein HINF_LOCUS59068 [Hexamita inflata]